MKWLFLRGRRKNVPVPCISRYSFVRRLRDGSQAQREFLSGKKKSRKSKKG
jgi:hypothetical protein